ncbi:hypothetical protein H9Q69_011448 [Fusarium xylarioides]|nr:hypothetical protein H9Q69_011448 [Fusarium xylarioides]KAG5808062.1 hypothetical protein H9Q71_007373 [Fusarium xylarioides]KAG5821857.1 hypothetical protein H9Q74_007987 [Fusarium xylarioides]
MATNPSAPITDLINKVRDGSINLSDLTVENCPRLPLKNISPKKVERLYIQMVDEVFKTAGVDKVDAQVCFQKCVTRLIHGKPFSASTVGDFKGRKSARRYVEAAAKLHADTSESVCIPAPQLVSMIVLLTIRKVRIGIDRFLSQNPVFFQLFGRFNMSQWLSLAIKFYCRLQNDIFVIRNDESLGQPQLHKKTLMNKEVWVVSINMSVDMPCILPQHLVDHIKTLERPVNQDVTMSGLNDSHIAESSDSDSSDMVTLTVTTTLGEALQKAGDLLQKLWAPDVNQASLKPQLEGWLSELHIRVMPRAIKSDLIQWCDMYSKNWCGFIQSCANDERETWEFETLVPVDSELHTPATGGLNFLRNIARLGKKAMRLSGSNPGEAQRLMGRYRDGLKLFSLHYENDVQTENRLKRIEGEVARIATAVEQITASRHNSKADIEEVWSLCFQQLGNVPDCVRRLAGANLTPEEMQELEARQMV